MPKQRQRLDDMPEFQRLSDDEKTQITRRMLQVYAAHRHPQRGVEVGKLLDQIQKELRGGKPPAWRKPWAVTR